MFGRAIWELDEERVSGQFVVDAVKDLQARHAEPVRRYHTLAHVNEVLAEVDRLEGAIYRDASARSGFEDWELAECVRLAACFHDAVYDPTAEHGASEAASAELATHVLGEQLRVQDRFVREIDRLIRLTVGHEVESDDVAGQVLVDADLWILSSPAERYSRYALAVRAEYAHVPDDLWAAGRGAVLTRFLDGIEALYRAGSPLDQQARRARATNNLRRELATLTR